MEAPVEIRYSGVILGRINEMPNAGEAAPFFLPMREPLPVGTVLHLRMEDRETPVRVVQTVESPDPDVAGMQVRAIGESEVVAFEFIPAPVPMLDAPKSEATTPVVETDAQKSAPEDAMAESGAAQAATDEQARAESTTSAAADTGAGPEAVPTAVGSSLTGALANATDSVATDGAAVSSEAAGDSSGSSGAASTEDLPPARPISGSAGRRKTKRRK